MKKVTFKYTCEFEDNISDEEAVACTVEVMSQADYDDDNFVMESDSNLASKAKRIVKAIETDFTDRRGLRQEWDQIDEEIREEIRETWRGIVEELL